MAAPTMVARTGWALAVIVPRPPPPPHPTEVPEGFLEAEIRNCWGDVAGRKRHRDQHQPRGQKGETEPRVTPLQAGSGDTGGGGACLLSILGFLGQGCERWGALDPESVSPERTRGPSASCHARSFPEKGIQGHPGFPGVCLPQRDGPLTKFGWPRVIL